MIARHFRRWYGAGPLNLLAFIACGALVGYVVHDVVASGRWERIVIWFLGAVIAHDLVMWPLYAIVDRTAVHVHHRHQGHRRAPQVPWINYLRVPVVISATLLAVSFPLVLRLSEATYHDNSGLTESPYLGRWLLVTGVLFGTSAVLYALRLARAGRSAAAEPSDDEDGA